ncbi:MAG: hypothetical protein NTW29_14925 [Bacteroidetes bacterium]|nr:hypothetical protein [Bacteroidota bacterium]
MTLSTRATNFLQTSEREDSQLTDTAIREIFHYNNAPVFEPLIEFEKKYGGYIFYAGLAPIRFSLIKGEGGYPISSKTAIVEFGESKYSQQKYFFDCATTLYQMQFFLDENGVYYEDYEPKASSFDKTVEHLAVWNEFANRKDFEMVFNNRILKTSNVDKELNLDLIAEASDLYTLWFRNEQMYMRQWQGKTTLIVTTSYPDKAKLLEL